MVVTSADDNLRLQDIPCAGCTTSAARMTYIGSDRLDEVLSALAEHLGAGGLRRISLSSAGADS